MNNNQLKKGAELDAILTQLRRHRQIIANSDSFAIGNIGSVAGSISADSQSPYFGEAPIFYKNVEKINDPGLQVAFSGFKAMLLSVYDQKIAALEKEFADL